MAVPELGQIRIIPDWFNYQIAKGVTLTTPTVNSGSKYAMLDHRPLNEVVFNTSGSTWYQIYAGTPVTGDWMFLIENVNFHTATVGNKTNVHFWDGSASVNSTENVLNYSNSKPQAVGLSVALTTNASINGISYDDINNNGWDEDITLGLLHLGLVYEMPTNATASLSYNTKFQNKVNTAFSGASYSTLYNEKPQRVLSASWEYINWSTGSSGIDDFTTMMNYSYGSHIPVALQLSQETPITAEHFIFCRITKWQQTQQSPNLWKVSAEFTEFI